MACQPERTRIVKHCPSVRHSLERRFWRVDEMADVAVEDRQAFRICKGAEVWREGFGLAGCAGHTTAKPIMPAIVEATNSRLIIVLSHRMTQLESATAHWGSLSHSSSVTKGKLTFHEHTPLALRLHEEFLERAEPRCTCARPGDDGVFEDARFERRRAVVLTAREALGETSTASGKYARPMPTMSSAATVATKTDQMSRSIS